MSTSNNKNSIYNSSISAGGNVHIGDVIHQHLQSNNSTTPEDTEPFTAKEAQQVKDLIANGKIEKALDLLLTYAKNEITVFNEVIQYARQWESLQRDSRIGVLSTDENFRLASRITFGILNVTDVLRKSE